MNDFFDIVGTNINTDVHNSDNKNPYKSHDDCWYWYDEVGDTYGPYRTHTMALLDYLHYLRWRNNN